MTKIEVPITIVCTVAAAGRPIEGMFVRCTLVTAKKNPYVLNLGPTDRRGTVRMERAEIVRRADIERGLAIMDYCPLDEVFTGVLRCQVMRANQIEDALRAYEVYKSVYQFPADYCNELRSALGALRAADLQDVSLKVSVDPLSVNVEVLDD